jgi:hypothetical protein
LNQDGNAQGGVSKAIKPEKVVVEDPSPDYPRYRVEPGNRASLAAIDPDETEHYRKKRTSPGSWRSNAGEYRTSRSASTRRTSGEC